MTQILEIDGPVSASRVVKQCDEILNETATSINTDIRNDRPTQFRPLPVINSLREVSSQMLAFQASPDTPDGIACSSALNAARQICYWSSLFMTMMDERNVVYPITTMPSSTSEPSMSSTLSSSSSSASVLSSMLLQHHPVILIIKCSNVICTTRSPSLFLISSAVSKFSYRSSASHLRFFAV